MNKGNNKSASADNAHGGCRKRTIRAVHKIGRSVWIIIKAISQGIVQAVKVWFEPRMERTV